MKFRVEITAHAQRDIEDIYEWIKRDSPKHAAAWHRHLLDRAATLVQMPRRCRIAPEAEALHIEVRHLLFGVYRILFVINEATVYIVHVRHGARRPLSAEEL